MSKTVAEIGESALLKRLRAILGDGPEDLLIPNGDDAAVLPDRGRLVISTDAVVADVHYHAGQTEPEDVGWKALAGALSDLAAKAADPYAVLTTLALPPETPIEWLERLYESFAERGRLWGAPIIGGDVVRAPTVMIDVVALGWLRTPKPVTLMGAQPGDAILVTGTLGGARLGLQLFEGRSDAGLNRDCVQAARERFLRPVPRLATSQSITDRIRPTAMTDVSDGLAKDLPKLARASGVGFRVDLEALPTLGPDRENAWIGGEDYELLLTVPESECEPLLSQWGHSGEESVPLTQIGTIRPESEGDRVEGLSEEQTGFEHFV